MARTQYLASKPRYEILDGRRIVRLHPMVIMGSLVGLLFYYFAQGPAFPLIGESPWWWVLLMFLYVSLMLPMPNAWDVRGWQDFNSFNGNAWSLYWEYVANVLYALVFRFLPLAALAVLTGVAALGTLDLTLNLNLTGLLDGRIGAPFTVNGGWSLTPAELYVGLVRLLYPFFAGLLLSRLLWRPALRGAFGWCSLLVGGMLLVPAMSGMANGLYEAAAILLLMPLIVAVCVFIVSVGVAYASLRLYDVPVRRWLTEKWLKRA